MTGSEPDLTEVFRDEATERLDDMDAALMAVESGESGTEMVDALFRDAHTIKGAAAMLGFDDIRTLAHAIEDVLGAIRDTRVFPADSAAPLLRATASLRAHVDGHGEPIGQLLAELAALRTELAGEPAPEQPAPEPAPAEAAPREAARPQAAALAQAAPVHQPSADKRALRVPAEKIDHLLDVVGEAMQYRRRLTHALGAEAQLDSGIADVFGFGERMLSELKDSAVGMRTLPLSVIAGPLPRAVRDLARAAGKDVEFAVTGADTELDRVILESLTEPLTHLLRNAVGHGIETPAERERAHKPVRGSIELRAVPQGSAVEIVVADDGRGVSPEVIEHARREGSLTDVLTRPGYSTAAEVSDVAGRGVGLDAVKTYVQAMGGSIEVRSEPGRGMTVTLLLPLALALLEVLLVERGGAVYGVPLASVEEVVLVDRTRTLTLEGRPALEIRGKTLPVGDFAALLGAQAPPPGDRSPALVISAGGRRAVATCDALVGQEEVVVKPLGPLVAGAAGYLGTAILGDGRIALLVEPARLTRGRGPDHTGKAAAAVPEPAVPEPAVPGPAVAPPKVLVVEDSFTVRELQRSILEAAGYPVATARDGRDALRVLGGDPGIALVITDLEMPHLDGLGLTRAIRADPERQSLPVVVVTSHGSDVDRRQGADAGADAYMVKREFDQQALLATVERLVGR
ncbi:MAG TPA: response regulator [Gaiellales bacterium]|nr:response regulator [Gaiellales bacterium]